MQRSLMGMAVLSAMFSLANADASDFAGAYAGANISADRSALKDATNTTTTKNVGYLGLGAGYNWDIKSIVLGLNGFADFHKKAYSGNDYGFDAKLGVPLGRWMPYAKLGVVGTDPGARAHGGLGLEFKLADSLSLTGEWTTDRKSKDGINYKNNDFGLGLNYYFYQPKSASLAEAEVAPVIAKAPEPVPVPAPAPVAAAPAPEPAPAPVAAPEPVPAPVVAEAIPAPAPKPVESWKTVLVEKPFTLEGASFALASDKLLKGADKKLDEVVEIAKRYPDIKLEVGGYTDNQNKSGKNQILSERRAAAVKAYLVKKGVDASRIATAGYADAKPVADNATEQGRAANRRVEVHYVLKEQKSVRVTE